MSGSTNNPPLPPWMSLLQQGTASTPESVAQLASRIANASVQLVDTLRKMAELAGRIEDGALAAELRALISIMLADTQVVAESIVPIAKRNAAR